MTNWVPYIAVAISLLALGLSAWNTVGAHRDRKVAAADRASRLAAETLVKLDLVQSHVREGGGPLGYYWRVTWTLHNSGNATVWNPLVKLVNDEATAFSAIGAVPPGGQLTMQPVGKVEANYDAGWTGAPAVARWEDAAGVSHEAEIRASYREP